MPSPLRNAGPPLRYWVARTHADNVDTATLVLRPEDEAIAEFLPGQYAVLSLPGAAETAAPISGDPADDNGTLEVTVHSSLSHLPNGTAVGVRGPYGRGWDLDSAAGTDLLFVADGIGLVPVRPALLHALRHRRRYYRIMLVATTSASADLLFRDELEALAASAGLLLVVPADLKRLRFVPHRTTALVSGSTTMMRDCARLLRRRGVPARRIQLWPRPSMGLAAEHKERTCPLGTV